MGIITTFDAATGQYRAVDSRYAHRVVYADTPALAETICREFDAEMQAIFGMEMGK